MKFIRGGFHIKSVSFTSLVLLLFLSVQPLRSQSAGSLTADSTSTSKKSFFDKIKLSGYIQGQYQYGEKDADLEVGGVNENPDKPFNRFGVRRGRVKLVYEEGIASGTFQIDLTERGIALKDVYLNIKDPWIKTNAIRAGVFNRPFGYEIAYSSTLRESPERSTVFQTLFPDGRDMGAMLVLQPFTKSAFRYLKLEAGVFAGNGIHIDTDNRKDFIGHLSWSAYPNMNFSISAGASYYYGGVYQGTQNVYKMSNNKFVLDNNPANIGRYAKREYVGFDIQMILATRLGSTKLHAEYLFGQQPSGQNFTDSPNGGLSDYDIYIRNFRGGYVMLVHNIATSPFSIVAKYDMYDPNVGTASNDVGLYGTTKADAMQNTVGLGALWQINENIRLQAYYEIDNFEKSEHLDKSKSNEFTLRLQYKF